MEQTSIGQVKPVSRSRKNNKNRKLFHKKAWLSFERRRSLEGLVFTIPWIIGFLVFLLAPLVMSVKISFFQTTLMDLMGGTFIGFNNYKAIIQNPTYNAAIYEAIMSSVYQVPVIIGFSLFVAVLLKQKFPGRIYFRVVFFIPVILAGVIMSYLFTDEVGSISVFNQITQSNANFLSRFLSDNITGDIGKIIWRSSVEILIFLAALQSVPAILYEVVEIDGASSWESFWHVTLPYISPFVILNVVYAMVDSFVDATNPVMNLLAGLAKTGTNYGLASALSWIYLLLSLTIILLFLLFTRRWLR